MLRRTVWARLEVASTAARAGVALTLEAHEAHGPSAIAASDGAFRSWVSDAAPTP